MVYKLDRLARSPYLAYLIERAVEEHGARIVSATGEGTGSDSPEDELIRGILHQLNSYARRVTAIRTKTAMLYHQANGRRMSKLPPYGWRIDKAGPRHARSGLHTRMVRDETEQENIAVIRALREKGDGLQEIARKLTTAGRLCRGRPWHHEMIKRVLKR